MGWERKVLCFVLVAALAPSSGFGWGAYGHEQINDAAVQLFAEGRLPGPLGKWLEENRRLLQRLSITPDCEWKANRGCPVPDDETLAALAYQVDRFEHPLHFFEPDAFIESGAVDKTSAARLPAGRYLDVFRQYVALFARNMAHVLQFPRKHPVSNPGAPTARDVAENGTAPWRARQLFELAVRALVDRQTDQALLYLGTMGHYVGDMTQPFHGTMNYDGQVHSPTAKGIHAVFESKILERVAKQAKAKKDPETKLWSHFRATEAAVLEAARAHLGRRGHTIGSEQIVSEVILVAADGFQYVPTLMQTFADVIAADRAATAAQQQEFLEATVPQAGGLTVLSLADERMGAAAALLARLWQSAYEVARQVDAGVPVPAGAVEFDPELALRSYPKPTYLPKEASAGEHEEAPEDP